jgi:prepilin-type processing-associated H-X9-DG protein
MSMLSADGGASPAGFNQETGSLLRSAIMASARAPLIEINGRPATAEQLGYRALVNYGHFTTFRADDGRVRGLELHLRRLADSTRELFDADLDRDLVRDHIGHALRNRPGDASVRVDVFWPESDDAASVMVTVRPPAYPQRRPQALQTVAYQRAVPHIKHAGTFGLIHYGRLAERNGFDDALLTSPDGVVAEAGIANIAFFDGSAVLWPDAPALHGITMQLLQQRLPNSGIPSERATVWVGDLASFAAAFVTNALGIAPVGRIDDLAIPVDADLMKTITDAYESVPLDPI